MSEADRVQIAEAHAVEAVGVLEQRRQALVRVVAQGLAGRVASHRRLDFRIVAVVAARDVVQMHGRPQSRRLLGKPGHLDQAKGMHQHPRDVGLAVQEAGVPEQFGRRNQLPVGNGNHRSNVSETQPGALLSALRPVDAAGLRQEPFTPPWDAEPGIDVDYAGWNTRGPSPELAPLDVLNTRTCRRARLALHAVLERPILRGGRADRARETHGALEPERSRAAVGATQTSGALICPSGSPAERLDHAEAPAEFLNVSFLAA
jgi:hypothetical protein